MTNTPSPAFAPDPDPSGIPHVPPIPAPASGPAEVYPTDAEIIPAALPRVSGPESWVFRNMRPLLLICLALALNGGVSLLLPAPAPQKPAMADAAPVVENLTEEELVKKAWMPLILLRVAMLGAGALGSLGLLVVYAASKHERAWLRRTIDSPSVRPLPALRLLDLMAIGAAWTTAGTICVSMYWHFASPNMAIGVRMALGLAISAVAFSTAIVCSIWLARARAGGPHGSLGIWPFWKRSAANEARTVWWDIGLGLVTFPATLWLVTLVGVVNTQILNLLDEPQDHHQLLDVVNGAQNPWVLAAITLSATVGAALFEEILFRGVLYNVLRRYVGAMAGALVAALIFASVHFIWSQLLPLFMMGMIMTWLYDRSGRLIAGMTFHFVNNLFAMLTLLTMQQ